VTTTPAAEDALPAGLLERLASHGNVRAFPAHAILINEGDRTDSLYILLAGRVKLYSSADSGREIVLTVLTPGQYFGELSLDGSPRSLSAQTLEAARCCVIAADELRQFLAAEPDFAHHLTHKLMRMVRRLTEQVKSLALQGVYERIVRLLTELSDEAGAERVVRDKLTQQDIADRVGSSREMVNRIMKELVAGGYVASDAAHRLVIRRKLPAAW
jgi:CRP/FNR family transcriptional regulator, cyclic AMP receptor protein